MTIAVAPPPQGTVFTRDPVLITTAIFTFAQGVIAVLLISSVLSEVAGGILSGILTAAWAAASILFVKPATVPRQPLEELAAAATDRFQADETPEGGING